MPGDHELYSLFLAGDTKAYDELMIRYGDSLTVFLNAYLHDWHDAEDLMIEAFAAIMVKRPRIGEGSFKAYLYRTARNLASRFHSGRSRFQSFSLDSVEEELGSGFLTEEKLLDAERARMLKLCFERIDPQLREALWLVYFEDMSYEAAARVMGVSRKRVDHLLTRGKEVLRTELKKEGMTNAYQ